MLIAEQLQTRHRALPICNNKSSLDAFSGGISSVTSREISRYFNVCSRPLGTPLRQEAGIFFPKESLPDYGGSCCDHLGSAAIQANQSSGASQDLRGASSSLRLLLQDICKSFRNGCNSGLLLKCEQCLEIICPEIFSIKIFHDLPNISSAVPKQHVDV